MADIVSENTSFTQDLFSPLQFCEVVEEGNQQRLQQMQQHQSNLSESQITTLQIATHNHHEHQLTAHQSTLESPNVQHSVKEEGSHQQPIQAQLINVTETKSPRIINSVSAMEIYLTGNPVHFQSVSAPLLIQQSTNTQSVYEVQLARPTHQALHQLQLSPIQISGHSSPQSISISQQNPTQDTSQHANSPLNVGNVVSIDVNNPFNSEINSNSGKDDTSANTVGTQTSQFEDDEPQIVFTNVSSVMKQNKNVKNEQSVESSDSTSTKVENIPVKRTWRRPWKKKKEREKKVAIKRGRKVKRRRIVVQKRNIIHIDARHGPPIDTSKTLVKRESEEAIDQLRQKRQRIKLNRNSGREYVNRLGKVVKARKIGTPCNCPLKCWERMGSKVLDIFNNFWDLCDFNLQNSYLFTCLKLCDVKRRYTKRPADESRRQNTFEYFVRICGKHIKVCKKAFMSAHGLTSDKRLRTLFTQMKDGALIPELDKRGKHLRGKTQDGTANTHAIPLAQINAVTNCPCKTGAGLNSKPAPKTKAKSKRKAIQANSRAEGNKPHVFAPPPPHAVPHLHPHCPPSANHAPLAETSHAYIPNGEIYFPGHYLDPHQAMAHQHMNQIQGCQKMLEPPAYFMAGMKENTFHQ